MDVLIAHGSAQARQALARGLSDQDLTVLEVSDGARALETLMQADPPRLALVEWDLPELEGPELCRLVRDFHLGRPPYIILVTPSDPPRDITSGLEAGASDFIMTPVGGAELRARVEFGRRVVELPWGQPSAPQVREELRCIEALTGLCDRGTILKRLDQELERSRRDGAVLGVGVLDIDGLDRVNEAHGRAAGDAVLTEVAERLRAILRPYDGIGRLDGEEFLILMPRTGGHDVGQVLDRLRGAMAAEPFAAGGTELDVTVSLGGAWGSEESCEDILDQARRALDEAKDAGSDTVVAGARAELQAMTSDQWLSMLEA
jgi:two-component system cell cycle response regulator